MCAREVMKAAEAKADEVSKTPLPVIALKDCGRCKGTGIFRLASGAPAECAGSWCRRGKVPATRKDAAVWAAASREIEIQRLRILWAGCRDALKANPSKSQAWEIEHLMTSVTARGMTLKSEQ